MKQIPKILVVDDDQNLRKTLSDILRVKGYEVSAAAEGAAALAEIEQKAFDAVLVDLKLPDMDGIEVMVRIKAASPLTEVIILTGYASMDTAIDAVKKGAFSYLMKPYDMEELLLNIRHAIDRRHANQEIARLATFPLVNPDPMIEVSFEGEVSYLNPAAEDRFPDLIEKGLQHPLLVNLTEMPALLQQAEQQEVVREIEIDGIPYEQRISQVPDSNLLHLYVLDISKRKQAEVALLTSEHRYHRLFESAQDGIMIIGASTGQIVDINPFMIGLFGYPRESYLGNKPWEILPFKEVGTCEEVFSDILASGTSHTEVVPLNTKERVTLDVEVISNIYGLNGEKVVQCNLRDITERRRNESRIQKLNSLLLTIRSINEYLLVAESEDKLFHYVCDTLKKLRDIAGVGIWLKHPDLVMELVAYAGIEDKMTASMKLRLDDPDLDHCVVGKAVREGRPIVLTDLKVNPVPGPLQKVVQMWQAEAGAAIPLISEGGIIGLLTVYSTRKDLFDEETVRFLAEVATDIAVGVRSLRLDKKLHATLANLRKSMDATVEAIAGIIELRDPYTGGHERHVAQLATAIGVEMGLPERQIEGLHVAGYLHDIGKIAVPAEILSKTGPLTEPEYKLVMQHPKAGYDILKNLDFPWPVALAVLQHHERMDGSGYPQGLKGDEIIIEARILAVSDVVSAMSSHRTYRAASDREAVRNEITANKGTRYDARVVDACLSLFEKGFQFIRAT